MARRFASLSHWRTCFALCNYRRLYNEIAALSVERPTWPLSDLRRMTARERKYWIRFLRWFKEHQMGIQEDG